ncbi:MvaI/BcnI family restriction endonuclease [bacterium]
MNLKQLIKRLSGIKKQGFITTKRLNDTGIGKTLEDILGIKENNYLGPDIGEIELKAKRMDSSSMLTIATKSPEPRGINKILFERYKYKDKEGVYSLHSTVYYTRYNPQGFKISISNEKIILENKKHIEAYWPLSIFDEVLKTKSNKILLVFADTEGKRKTKKESFHFNEAYLLSELNLNKFTKALERDKLKIDIRIGAYRSGSNKGKYHDHGTGFRIHKRDFLELYDNYKKLI